jgi:putative hydrolase of the HAD superfamily
LFNDIETDHFFDVYYKNNAEQWVLFEEGKIDSGQLQHNRFAQTLHELGLDDRCSDAIGEQYLLFYQNYWQWIDGAEKAFKAIRKKYKVGILTNGFTEIQVKKFNQLDLYSQASELIISEEVGIFKPQSGIFEHATNVAGYQPGEILYIGDSYHADIAGGHNFGWKTGWFTINGIHKEQHEADFIFNNFKDLLDLLDC